MLTSAHETCIFKITTRYVSKGGAEVLEMNSKEIGTKLIELRGNRTQEEVANAVGISASALSMYENGERIPRDNIKIRLADYYKKPIHKIFFT